MKDNEYFPTSQQRQQKTRKEYLVNKALTGLLNLDEIRQLGRLREQDQETAINGIGLPSIWPGDIEQKFLRLLEINPRLANAIEQVIDMHIKKAHDYASKENPFINFENVAQAIGLDVDVVFRQFIATKLDRLRNLLSADKKPNNESINDTKLDLAVYALLYLAYSIKTTRDAFNNQLESI